MDNTATAVDYYACANADDKWNEDWCLGIIFPEEYTAKRNWLRTTGAWDAGQRPECENCEQAYADSYHA